MPFIPDPKEVGVFWHEIYKNISQLGHEKIRSSLISLLKINEGSFSANLKKKERKSYSELLANYQDIIDLEEKYSNHIPVFKKTKNTAIII